MSIISRLFKITTKSELNAALLSIGEMIGALDKKLSNRLDTITNAHNFTTTDSIKKIDAVKEELQYFKNKYEQEQTNQDVNFGKLITENKQKLDTEHKSRVEWQEKMNLRLTGIENGRPGKKK